MEVITFKKLNSQFFFEEARRIYIYIITIMGSHLQHKTCLKKTTRVTPKAHNTKKAKLTNAQTSERAS